MYIHVSTEDHKNIAGIAYLQIKLKELNPNLKIDGMMGAETIVAFRDAIEKGLKIADFRVDLQGVGMNLIQSMIRQAVMEVGRKDFPIERLHDGQWGDGTKKAIDLILNDAMFKDHFKAIRKLHEDNPRPTTKLSDSTLRSVQDRVRGPRKSLVPLVYDEQNKVKEGTHWCTGMEYEVTEQTDKLLAKAMGYENPVITIHQMLAANYQIALEYYRGRAVGIIIIRKVEVVPFTSVADDSHVRSVAVKDGETHLHGYIEGIYVNKNIRGVGVGTRLLVAAKYQCEQLGYERIVFVRGPATHSLEDTIDGVRNPKERIFDQLVNGHGYRPIATALDVSRAERCVRYLNKK